MADPVKPCPGLVVFGPATLTLMDHATELGLRARLGDRAAMDDLVQICYRPVWRYCAVMVSVQDAEDLAQETFERALRALHKFRGESTVMTWLVGIARHACIDRLRRDQRSTRRSQQLAGAVSRQVANDPAERTVLFDLVGRLDPCRREAFVLTQVLGFTYPEVASIYGCPVGTVSSRVARARFELLAMAEADETRSDGRGGLSRS